MRTSEERMEENRMEATIIQAVPIQRVRGSPALGLGGTLLATLMLNGVPAPVPVPIPVPAPPGPRRGFYRVL